MENFLKTSLPMLHGSKVKSYRKRITKCIEKLHKEDHGVSVDEFLSFRYFFEEIELVKAKCHRYRFLEADQFEKIVAEVTKDVKIKRSNKPVTVPTRITRIFFDYLDEDDSGELEPDELLAFQATSMGQSQETKAKDESIEKFNKFIAKMKKQFNEMTGMAI